MNYYFKLAFNSFKFGLAFNFFTLILIVSYTLLIENYFRPFQVAFNPLVEFGTAVSGMKIFSGSDPKNHSVRPAWAKIEPQFGLFIPEFQLRADWKQPSPRLESWCKTRNCCAHRISFTDRRIRDFRCFTLDDWYLSHRDLLGSQFDGSVVSNLDIFLFKLPKGSRIIVNEPYVLFSDRRSFEFFTQWFLGLAAKHPGLHFEIGLQVHLQWIDSYWWQYHGWLIPALGEFGRRYRVRWGITEFSIYDHLWKPRIAYGGATPPRMRLLDRFEQFIPDRFLRAVVAHQAYIFHRDALRAGASHFVEWGNFPTTWFAAAIDPGYKSTFGLYDWQGNPQLMYWAIARALTVDSVDSVYNPNPKQRKTP
jgi:hypothetical protein